MAEEKPTIDPEIAAAFEEGRPVFYANNIHVNTSLNDIRLAFGKRNPYGPSSYDVHVYMSLPTAKQMVAIMIQHIGQYEQEFGEVQPIVQPVETGEKK